MSFNWKTLVGSVAPTLATALGGPLAGMAVQAIGGALGLSDATEEKLSQTLAGAKPEDLLKLKQADQDFAVKMKSLDIDLVRIAAADTDSARKREMAVKDRTPSVLAAVFIIGAIAIGIAVISGNAPAMKDASVAALAGTIVGYVFNDVKQIVAYYFGSSAGSVSKDATISEIAKS
jgi:hypothetical protein